eukprot:scaffold81283_cov34-Phaeocystis_antarctica.AAC.1
MGCSGSKEARDETNHTDIKTNVAAPGGTNVASERTTTHSGYHSDVASGAKHAFTEQLVLPRQRRFCPRPRPRRRYFALAAATFALAAPTVTTASLATTALTSATTATTTPPPPPASPGDEQYPQDPGGVRPDAQYHARPRRVRLRLHVHAQGHQHDVRHEDRLDRGAAD